MWLLSRLLLMLAVFALAYAAVVAFVLWLPWSIVIALALLYKRVARPGPLFQSDAYGTARWASMTDLIRAGMLGAKRGLCIGWYSGDES
jgi:hypothetical protein